MHSRALGGDSVLLVRGGERLRAFHNVSWHRGAENAAGADESCIAHFHARLREKLHRAPSGAEGEVRP